MSGKGHLSKLMDLVIVNSCIEKAIFSTSAASVRLRLAQDSDAAFILKLRSDSRLNAHLSTTSSELQQQQAWMHGYAERNAKGEEHYFIIESGHQPVGTIRMYDYQLLDRSFCWGSWIVRRGASPECAMASLLQLYDIGFRSAEFMSARFNVRSDNLSVLAFHRRIGAQEVRREGADVHFRIERGAYEQIVRPKILYLHAKVS